MFENLHRFGNYFWAGKTCHKNWYKSANYKEQEVEDRGMHSEKEHGYMTLRMVWNTCIHNWVPANGLNFFRKARHHDTK